jgi:hypothetical protein
MIPPLPLYVHIKPVSIIGVYRTARLTATADGAIGGVRVLPRHPFMRAA